MDRLVKLYQLIIESGLRSSILIGIICLCTFGNTILNDYNLDDNLVTQNHRLTSKGIGAIPEIYRSPYYQDDMGYSYGYRPTVLASFAIEHEFFGESAKVSHTINFLLYLITCVLIFFLIKRIFPDQAAIALGAALLFTVHPIHTEVVASIKNRDEILSLLFSLLGCFILIRPKYFLPNLLLASGLFFLSLTSKLSAVNLILLLALIPAYPKPILKDLALLSLYSASLYFVFEGRDVLNDNRLRNVSVIFGLFLTVRLIFSGALVPTSRLVAAALVRVWRRINISGLLKKMRTENTFQYSWLRIIEILISSSIALWLIREDGNTWALACFILSLLSLMIFKTNRPDSFFRNAIPLLIGGIEVAFVAFFILDNLLLVISNRNNIKTSVTHQIIGLLLLLGFLGVLNEDGWDYVSAFVTVLLSLLYVNLKSKYWDIIVVILAIGLAYFLKSVYLLPIWVSAFTITIIFLPAVWHKKTTIRELLSFTELLTLDKLHVTRIKSNKLVLGLIALSFAYWMFVGPDTPTPSFSIPHYQMVNSNFDPTTIWSAENTLSWKRPFDYLEHPLSPFAPITWKLGTGMVTLLQYFKKLLFPYPLAFYYGFDEVTIVQVFSPLSIASILIHLMLLITAIKSWKRAKAISIGIFLYLSSIVLFSGLVEIVAGMFSDRFGYVASFGFCLAIAAGVHQAFKINKKKEIRIILVSVSLLLLCTFSGYSIYRNALWKDKLTLMKNDIKHVPRSAQAHNLLAHAIMEDVFKDGTVSEDEMKTAIPEAEQHFVSATNIYPRFFNVWVDLGKVLTLANRYDEAITAYTRALEIDSSFYPILLEQAKLFELINKPEEAILCYSSYIHYAPPQFEAYDNLARLLFEKGDYKKSKDISIEYLKHDPQNLNFKRNIETINEATSRLD